MVGRYVYSAQWAQWLVKESCWLYGRQNNRLDIHANYKNQFLAYRSL